MIAQTDHAILPFRAPVEERLLIRGMLFGGFSKCLYPAQKFESDSERRFAIILEDESSVLKWLALSEGGKAERYDLSCAQPSGLCAVECDVRSRMHARQSAESSRRAVVDTAHRADIQTAHRAGLWQEGA